MSEVVSGWAIRHWNGGLYIETVRRTRREAIAAFKERFGFSDAEWNTDRDCGVHKAVWVDVEPVVHHAVEATK